MEVVWEAEKCLILLWTLQVSQHVEWGTNTDFPRLARTANIVRVQFQDLQ